MGGRTILGACVGLGGWVQQTALAKPRDVPALCHGAAAFTMAMASKCSLMTDIGRK